MYKKLISKQYKYILIKLELYLIIMEEFNKITVKKFRTEGFATVSKYDTNAQNIFVCDQNSNCITKINAKDYDIRKYEGHDGIIWDLAILENDIMVSVSGDFNFIMYEISSGNIIMKKDLKGIPKLVASNNDSNIICMYVETVSKSKDNELLILRNVNKESLIQENYFENNTVTYNIDYYASALIWNNDELVIGDKEGVLRVINPLTGEIKRENKFHNDVIKSFDKSTKFKNLFLTCSLDGNAKEINIESLETVMTYSVDFPLNVARYNFNNRKIYVGGGVDVMNVATTENNDLTLKVFTRDGKMKNLINGHCGPIRFLNFSKHTKNFVSAGQDGIILIYVCEENNEKVNQECKVEIDEKEELMQDIFGNMRARRESSLSEDIVMMKNLTYKAPRVEKTKYVLGMPKTPEMLERERKEKESEELLNKKREERKNRDDSSTVSREITSYGIKVTDLPFNTKESKIRDIFESYGRLSGRGINIKKYERKIRSIDGKSEIPLKELVVYVNYTREDSAIKAQESMNKKAFNNNIIKIDLLKNH